MEKKDHVLLGAALTVGAVEDWLGEHVDPETGYVVDDTLAIEGAAADSKATGEAIAAVEAAIPAVDATLATTGAAADAKKTGDEIADLKSAFNEYILIAQSDLTRGAWENGSITSWDKRLCNTNLIPIKKGDRVQYSSGTLYVMLAIYPTGSTTADGSTGWVHTTELKEYIAPGDGNLIIGIKKEDGSTVAITDYDCTIKIYSNYTGHLLSVIDAVDDYTRQNADKVDNYIASYPALRNGTSASTSNAQQVAFTQIIPYEDSRSVTILVKKPVSAEGNYWRLVFTTYSIASGKPEDNQSKLVTEATAIDSTKVTIYKGLFDIKSQGFTIAIAEKKPNGDVVTHRITDFNPGDVVLIRDYSFIDTSGKYEYMGERITLKQSFDYGLFGHIASALSSKALQSIAVHGNKLIALYNTGYFNVYDLEPFTGSVSKTGQLSALSDSLHCNTCSFGQFYNNSDALPLLYVTGGVAGSVAGYCVVERFDSTYSTTRIQTISIDYTDFSEYNYVSEFNTPNFYVDGGYLWTYSSKYRTNGSEEAHDNENRFVIHKYSLPSLSNETVVLTAADVLDEFILPYDAFYMQGGTAHSGKMFAMFGHGGTTMGTKAAENAMLIYNLAGGKQIAKVNMSALQNHAVEIESAAVFGQYLFVLYGDGYLFSMLFN